MQSASIHQAFLSIQDPLSLLNSDPDSPETIIFKEIALTILNRVGNLQIWILRNINITFSLLFIVVDIVMAVEDAFAGSEI